MKYIYGLVDPRTRLVRYVGKTTQTPERRWKGHRKAAPHGSTRRDNWIKQLLAAGLEAVPITIECSADWSDEDLCRAEEFWIREYRHRFGRDVVTNHADGGVVFDIDKMRASMREAHTRRDKSALSAWGREMAARGVNVGRKHTPETIERMSAAKRGKGKSEETRARMSAAKKAQRPRVTVYCGTCGCEFQVTPSRAAGRKHHYCTHEHYAQSLVGTKHSDETKAKRSAAMLGQPKSEAHRASIRRGRWGRSTDDNQ